MATVRQLREGIQILSKYMGEDEHFACATDATGSPVLVTDTMVRREDKDALERLGWRLGNGHCVLSVPVYPRSAEVDNDVPEPPPPPKGGEVTVGFKEQAVIGEKGRATAAECGQAVAGDGGEAIAGMMGQAIVGIMGKATVGTAGTALAGFQSDASAGLRGQAYAGDDGRASAGANGLAVALSDGIVRGGQGCVLLVLFRTNGRNGYAVGQVGVAGIHPNIWYEATSEGVLKPVVGTDPRLP